MRVYVCLLARATRAVEGRKAHGEARSGRTSARTESKSLKIGSHALFNDWTTRFFLPRVFFHKATYAQSLQGDGSEHAAPLCEGPAQFAQFSKEKQGSTEKKKRAKKQIFKNHKKKKKSMIRRSWFWESYCFVSTLLSLRFLNEVLSNDV